MYLAAALIIETILCFTVFWAVTSYLRRDSTPERRPAVLLMMRRKRRRFSSCRSDNVAEPW